MPSLSQNSKNTKFGENKEFAWTNVGLEDLIS